MGRCRWGGGGGMMEHKKRGEGNTNLSAMCWGVGVDKRAQWLEQGYTEHNAYKQVKQLELYTLCTLITGVMTSAELPSLGTQQPMRLLLS